MQWHYEGHYANEIERLDQIRVKKNPKDFPPETESRRKVRDLAMERISQRRSRRRLRLQAGNAGQDLQAEQQDLICPVCNLPVSNDHFKEHIEHCLEHSDVPEEEDDVDIDTMEGVETYTWAGHTRVRATSLVQGGLRGPGFVAITQSDEDQVLDIEGDDGEDGGHSSQFGAAQFSESDLILPQPENEDEAEDLQSRSDIQEILTGQKPKIMSQLEPDCERLRALEQENDDLRQKAMCNICMDSYRRPLVSTKCWHVSCEECWMRALGTKKLCPQCKVIIQPKDLRRIYL